ncbi:hypothetical protein RFI_28462 [Reticulomyxa filosa]|uniref:Uncharacterized protein n=1 Tax=Reticulomyxa filosa TaxID=46433 RepID=X6M7C8_RETFI|nr:hypothetical protein RFI_28462 [Reticulomyxa filosa]|eukprot:ETO08925.1 hypothetical protein RFI_28462 [Reticulomyxa filosa]
MDTLRVFVELNFHHLVVVDIYVLDHLTKQFIYGMLKHQNHYMFSMDMKMLFGVLIFHHYKAIITNDASIVAAASNPIEKHDNDYKYIIDKKKRIFNSNAILVKQNFCS